MTVQKQQALLECQAQTPLWRHWDEPHSHWGAGKGAETCVGEVTHETKRDVLLQSVPAEVLAGSVSSLWGLSVLKPGGCRGWATWPGLLLRTHDDIFCLSTMGINIFLRASP